MSALPSKSVRVELPFTPYAHQKAAHALRLVTRFLVLVWHRRAGKTVFAVVELVLAACAATREASRFAYVAPFRWQAKATAWDYLKRFALCVPGTEVNEAELWVQFVNGARIRLYGADSPDAMRGQYFDGVVMDEVADMKPDVWSLVVLPALTDRQGWALFIGTPKGTNLFSELFHAALKAAGADGWNADLRRASETGVIQPTELEAARRGMSPAQFAQEFDCDFAAAVDDVLIRLDLVLAAQARDIRDSEFDFAAKVLGVDCARYGDDSSVIQPRQGLMAFAPKARRGLDTMSVAAWVAEVEDRWQPDATFVDVGGIGAGVVDRLRQLGRSIIPVDFGGKANDPKMENKRAEMWCAVRDWLEAGGVLPSELRLKQDLSAPRYTYANARGRLQLESKDDMRARGLPSTDYGDALATTFFAPVSSRNGRARAQQTQHQFDPFERAS